MNAKPADMPGEGVSYTDSDEATPTGASEFDALLKPKPTPAAAEVAAAGDLPYVVEADVDGKRVRIVAQDEIVLQCGEASITLRRNGRIVIKGTYIETCSEGTNRIKGGQVRIN